MIYVECNPDKSLVKSLTGVTRKEITHEYKGKGEICNRLAKQSNCKGLVDEDPTAGQPRYMTEATLEDDISEYDIRVLKDANGNLLIILCPRLEDWILKAARDANLDVRKYGLPDDPKRLHREINLSLDKYEKLLEDLKKSSNRLKTLKKLLEAK